MTPMEVMAAISAARMLVELALEAKTALEQKGEWTAEQETAFKGELAKARVDPDFVPEG